MTFLKTALYAFVAPAPIVAESWVWIWWPALWMLVSAVLIFDSVLGRKD